MRLSLATSLLLASLPAGLSFTPIPSRCATSRSPTGTGPGPNTASSTRLHYQEEQATPDAHLDTLMDMSGAISGLGIGQGQPMDNDLEFVESLAFSLDLDEEFLVDQYHAWARKYHKEVAETNQQRFFNWKRNYLMQEVWNRTNGETFDLNEFGDFTKQEFDDKFKTNKNMEETTLSDVEDVSIPEIPDASHAFHFKVHEGQVSRLPEESMVPINRKFKQVKTFAGGFRLVPCSDKEELIVAPLAAPMGSSTNTRAAPAGHFTGFMTTTARRDGNLFKKVALLKTRQ